MSSLVVLNMISIVIAFMMMAFAVFALGFLMGYKIEDRRVLKKKQESNNIKNGETKEEIKAKKEWKKFLEYDGSAPNGVDN